MKLIFEPDHEVEAMWGDMVERVLRRAQAEDMMLDALLSGSLTVSEMAGSLKSQGFPVALQSPLIRQMLREAGSGEWQMIREVAEALAHVLDHARGGSEELALAIAPVLSHRRLCEEYKLEGRLRGYFANVEMTDDLLDEATLAALQSGNEPGALLYLAVQLALQVYERARQIPSGRTPEIDRLAERIDVLLFGMPNLFNGGEDDIKNIAKLLGPFCTQELLKRVEKDLGGGLPGAVWVSVRIQREEVHMTDLEAQRRGNHSVLKPRSPAVTLWERLQGKRAPHPGETITEEERHQPIDWRTVSPFGESDDLPF